MNEPKLKRGEFIRVSAFTSLSVLLTSCLKGEPVSNTQPIPAEPAVKPNFISEKQPELTNDLEEVLVREGEGIIQAIERQCSESAGQACSINEFADLGVLWARDGQPFAYIQNKQALFALSLLSDLGGTKLNDLVGFGTVQEASEAGREGGYFESNVIQVRASAENINGAVYDVIQVSGGPYRQPVTLKAQAAPERGQWEAEVSSQTYSDISVALQKANQEP